MGLVKRYSTTHFLLNGLGCNIPECTRGVMLNIPTNFEGILKKLKFW